MAAEPRMFPCNTCSVTFTTSELQRSHMRQSWHIYNLRRRVAELSAVSQEEYNAQYHTQEPTLHVKNSSDSAITPSSSSPVFTIDSISPYSFPSRSQSTKAEDIFAASPTKCLFCPISSPSLSVNIDHMYTTHNLFIPSPDRLYDLPSFLGYLATIVFEYKECLYCSVEKGTVAGVQTHMRDKGHCTLDLQAGSELLDFWEPGDLRYETEDGGEDEGRTVAVELSRTEMRLPSGAIINARSEFTQLRQRPGLAHSRRRGTQFRNKRHGEHLAVTAGTEQEDSSNQPCTKDPSRHDHRVAVRGEMGLLGVSENQRRALQVTEMKMRKREALVKTAGRHAMEQQPIKVMYYKTENPVYQAG